MNKKMVLNVALVALITGLIGFYSGRYYERKVFRNNMEARFSEEGRQVPEGFVPGQGRGDGTGPREGGMMPTPPEATPSK